MKDILINSAIKISSNEVLVEEILIALINLESKCLKQKRKITKDSIGYISKCFRELLKRDDILEKIYNNKIYSDNNETLNVYKKWTIKDLKEKI